MLSPRFQELKKHLTERREEILAQVREGMQEIPSQSEGGHQPTSAGDADFPVPDDINFALLQMKAETAHRLEEALTRLEAGTYGNCTECGKEISERRLVALPFAIRCKKCEEVRELAERRAAALRTRRPESL